MGNKFWYIEDTLILHREDGPAIEWYVGAKEWWYHNKQISVDNQEDFKRYLNLKVFE